MPVQIDMFAQDKRAWIAGARLVARRIAGEKGVVCADDLHEVFPYPDWWDGRCMGAVFNGLLCCGYKKSARKECHNRPIGIFKIKEEVKNG